MQGQLGAKTRLAYSGHPIGTTRGEMWPESKSAPMYLEVEGPHSHHHMYSRSEPSEVSLTGPQADGGAKAGGLQCSQPGLHSEAIYLWSSVLTFLFCLITFGSCFIVIILVFPLNFE